MDNRGMQPIGGKEKRRWHKQLSVEQVVYLSVQVYEESTRGRSSFFGWWMRIVQLTLPLLLAKHTHKQPGES